jgi:hypothetical protein
MNIALTDWRRIALALAGLACGGLTALLIAA